MLQDVNSRTAMIKSFNDSTSLTQEQMEFLNNPQNAQVVQAMAANGQFDKLNTEGNIDNGGLSDMLDNMFGKDSIIGKYGGGAMAAIDTGVNIWNAYGQHQQNKAGLKLMKVNTDIAKENLKQGKEEYARLGTLRNKLTKGYK